MLIVHLFVSYAHVNLCHFFSSSWCWGLAAASACGSSWTFLFTFLLICYDMEDFSHPQVRCLQKFRLQKFPESGEDWVHLAACS